MKRWRKVEDIKPCIEQEVVAEVAETVGAWITHYDRAVLLTQCKLKTPGFVRCEGNGAWVLMSKGCRSPVLTEGASKSFGFQGTILNQSRHVKSLKPVANWLRVTFGNKMGLMTGLIQVTYTSRSIIFNEWKWTLSQSWWVIWMWLFGSMILCWKFSFDVDMTPRRVEVIVLPIPVEYVVGLELYS